MLRLDRLGDLEEEGMGLSISGAARYQGKGIDFTCVRLIFETKFGGQLMRLLPVGMVRCSCEAEG